MTVVRPEPPTETPQAAGAQSANLRQRALRGGAYLVGRHFVVVALALVGQPLLARMIGPAAYGLWVAARQLSDYARGLCTWGIDLYLIRKEGELPQQASDQAFTVLAALGVAGALLTLLALPWIQRWTRLTGLSPVLAALTAVMPLSLVSLVPFARLERALDYRALASVELFGRVLFYAGAVALAGCGWGVWALVSAAWLEQIFALALLHAAARYRPRLCHDGALAREMLSYGLGFSASIWIYQLRGLVAPFIVGRYAGSAAIGYIGLAERLVGGLSFVKSAAWRLSMAVLAKVQDDRERLGRAMSEAITLQVLVLGPLLLVFGWSLPYLVSWIFGPGWRPVERIYPFVAAGCLANSAFNIHSSALYVLRRNRRVAIFHTAHVLLFAGSAFILVRSLDWIGYGWAEILALPSYALLHAYTVREVKGLRYGPAPVIAFAFGFALFARQLGWPAYLGLVLVSLHPETWRLIRRQFSEVWGRLRLWVRTSSASS